MLGMDSSCPGCQTFPQHWLSCWLGEGCSPHLLSCWVSLGAQQDHADVHQKRKTIPHADGHCAGVGSKASCPVREPALG